MTDGARAEKRRRPQYFVRFALDRGEVGLLGNDSPFNEQEQNGRPKYARNLSKGSRSPQEDKGQEALRQCPIKYLDAARGQPNEPARERISEVLSSK